MIGPSGHMIERCGICGVIIRQCRCPDDGSKRVILGTCALCDAREKQHPPILDVAIGRWRARLFAEGGDPPGAPLDPPSGPPSGVE